MDYKRGVTTMTITDILRKPVQGAGKMARKAAFIGLAALAVAGMTPNKADAALITDVNLSPYNSSITTPSGYGGFGVDISITNPYDNVTLDSAVVGNEFIEGFADSAVALNPSLDRNEIITYFNQTLDLAAESDYRPSNGWSENQDAEGTHITNDGGRRTPEWTKDGTAIIHGTFDAGWLDTDGTPGYNPLTDATLMQDATNVYHDIVVGTSTGGAQYGGNLDRVTAVPEPTTAALIGIGAALVAVRRKRK